MIFPNMLEFGTKLQELQISLKRGNVSKQLMVLRAMMFLFTIKPSEMAKKWALREWPNLKTSTILNLKCFSRSGTQLGEIIGF